MIAGKHSRAETADGLLEWLDAKFWDTQVQGRGLSLAGQELR